MAGKQVSEKLKADVAVLRRFNRFYTRQAGLIEPKHLHTDVSLPEARILYELAHRDRSQPAELIRDLGIDAGPAQPDAAGAAAAATDHAKDLQRRPAAGRNRAHRQGTRDVRRTRQALADGRDRVAGAVAGGSARQRRRRDGDDRARARAR